MYDQVYIFQRGLHTQGDTSVAQGAAQRFHLMLCRVEEVGFRNHGLHLGYRVVTEMIHFLIGSP